MGYFPKSILSPEVGSCYAVSRPHSLLQPALQCHLPLQLTLTLLNTTS